MKKIFVIFALLFIVIEGMKLSPVNEEEKEMHERLRRDVSSLFGAGGRQNVIFGNNVMGRDADILHFVYRIAPNDNYYFAYKQSDLQEREETGTFEFDAATNQRKLSVNGFFEYIRPDGKKQRIDYVADENGFRPLVAVS